MFNLHIYFFRMASPLARLSAGVIVGFFSRCFGCPARLVVVRRPRSGGSSVSRIKLRWRSMIDVLPGRRRAALMAEPTAFAGLPPVDMWNASTQKSNTVSAPPNHNNKNHHYQPQQPQQPQQCIHKRTGQQFDSSLNIPSRGFQGSGGFNGIGKPHFS